MAYKSCLILSMYIFWGLGLLPPWQGGRLSISPSPAQTATATRPTLPTETSTPSSTATLKPTLTATGTPSPTPSPTPTLPPTLTPTATAALSLTPPSPCPCSVYLPLVSVIPPTVIQEIEPNDTFSQAQSLYILPVSVYGTHDGATDTGDVYQTALTAGQIVYVTLTTKNSTGVQLLAYSGENPNEIVRDFEAPFELTFLAIATDTYFLYVFTPGEVNNTGAYTLSAALSEATP